MNGRRWLSSLAMMIPALAVMACDAPSVSGDADHAASDDGSGGSGGGAGTGSGSGGAADDVTSTPVTGARGSARSPAMRMVGDAVVAEGFEREEAVAHVELDQGFDGEVGVLATGEQSEACPGELLQPSETVFQLGLGGGDATSLGSGTRYITETTVDDHDSCWSSSAGVDGGERVFQIDLKDPGILGLTLTTTGFDGKLVIQSTCDTDEYCFDNAHDTNGSTQEKVALARPAGITTVIVEATGTGTGSFVLNATLNAPSCGDGVISGVEECDPGALGKAEGDGCDASCMIESMVGSAGDSCSNATPIVGPTTTVPVEYLGADEGYTTLGFNDDYMGGCMPDPGGSDRVFAIMPAVTGQIRAKVGFMENDGPAYCAVDASSSACFDVELYARTSCENSTTSEIACDSTCCDGEQIVFNATQDVPVYLFVDGYDDQWYSEGPFNVYLEYVGPNL